MTPIIKQISFTTIACMLTSHAMSAVVTPIGTCDSLTEISCTEEYETFGTSVLTGNAPSLQNDTMLFSGMYCNGAGDASSRKCFRVNGTQTVGLAMNCKCNTEVHQVTTCDVDNDNYIQLPGKTQIGSCHVSFDQFPPRGASIAPGSPCTATSECEELSGKNGCQGWYCDTTTKTCQCVYCGSNKTVTSNKMGCNCNRDTTNCLANYYNVESGTGYQILSLTFQGDSSCLNADTVCADKAAYCLNGYYGTAPDCKKCDPDSFGNIGETKASWDNYATTKTNCYIPKGKTGTDADGTLEYTNNCYYKND